MSRVVPFILFLILFSVTNLIAQSIPDSAVVLETANVTPTRQLILWMPNPLRNPRDTEEVYTCPEETRGHYYSGTAKVSLINLETKKIINTLKINANGEESIDLPYLIKSGYYKVSQVDANKEGKPQIMNLKDYNADGKPYEFALFNALACMGLDTTLIGYSAKQDKVIQYPVEIKIQGKNSKGFWADYLFTHKPVRKGNWVYQIDYRGRGGSLDKYDFYYDRKNEKFYGKLKSRLVN